MTRSISGIVSFQLIVLLAAGCGPEPVRPRPLVAPPADAAPPDLGRPDAAPPDAGTPPDAGAAPAMPDAGPAVVKDAGGGKDADVEVPGDGGVDAGVDAGNSREKLPAPDGGGIPAPAVDAGTGADAGGADTIDPEPADAGSETPSVRRPAAAEVRIVEVHVNPAGQDTGREWIEIASRAGEPLDLGALHLADAAGDVAVAAGVIQPGARLVLGQSADVETNGGVTVAVAYGTRLALNNDGDEISICLGPCTDGVVIDRVAWGTLGAAYDGHALILDVDTSQTCPATEQYGLADFGTPGAPDSGCAALAAGI